MIRKIHFMRVLFFLSLMSFPFFIHPQDVLPFQDPDLSISERVTDLINRLTPEEKVSMLVHESPGVPRLGIPAYNWWNEALHGVGRAGKATVFPQAIGLAATFDPDLLHRVGEVISTEARAKYNAALKKGTMQQYTGLTFWSPNVNIFRDPRWGRGQETYGEDPYLSGLLGTQFVRGVQGDDPKYLKAAACAKHLAVHSGPEALRHEFNAVPTDRDLHETYFPAFKDLVDAGVVGVMCAYNQLNGEPCCGSNMLLETILRDLWQFKGYIVSDCGALYDFYTFQEVAGNATDAAIMALLAGVNVNCGSTYLKLTEALDSGEIDEFMIDRALEPLFETRFRLGILDKEDNTPFAGIGPEMINCEAHQKVAYEAAVKSVVLLKNENNALPLDPDAMKKILVTGPTANDIMALIGNYNGLSPEFVTLIEGIINKADPATVVDFAQGTLLSGTDKFNGLYPAIGSDAIIVGIGNTRLLEGENGDALLSEYGGDREGIGLPENQVELFRRFKERFPETPLIAVVFGGSAISLAGISDLADAILFAWYPGEQGGNAIADIIFGFENPSGRLPVTFYNSVDDLPPFEDYHMEGRTYKYFRAKPEFPFGHGMSYTSFAYSGMQAQLKEERGIRSVNITLTVRNNGQMAGEEVVQLYVKKPFLNDEDAIRSLVGIRRVRFQPGQSKEITMAVPAHLLASFGAQKGAFHVLPGSYEFQAGASSGDIRISARLAIE